MIFEIDDIIPFCRREGHINETIRLIVRYDSGYLKDLFVRDSRVVFSNECLRELLVLTAGHKDNWKQPERTTGNFLNLLKPYAGPYLFDFNDTSVVNIPKMNEQRQMLQ